MAASTLVKKLLIKPGHHIAIVNPPPGFAQVLAELPTQVDVFDEGINLPDHSLDVVQVFVRNKAELARLVPRAARKVTPGGLLWLCYQKRTAKTETDLSRDILWQESSTMGLTGVTLISIDDEWSAMRFRAAPAVNLEGTADENTQRPG